MRKLHLHFTRSAALLLLLSGILPKAAEAKVEPFWGAREFYTQKGHLRYLLLLPPHYDPRRKYELWLSLHGSPGCAELGIYFYFPEAQQRQVFLLAPQGTGDAVGEYERPDGKQGFYRFLDMRRDRDHILAVLDEVLAKYPIDRSRIALLGFSAGCEMGWRLLAARPNTFYFFGGVANGFKRGRPPVSEEALRRAARHVAHFYAAGRADSFAGPMFKRTAKKLRQYGFELRTAYPAGVGHALPPSIKIPLLAFMDEVRAKQSLEKTIRSAASKPDRSSPSGRNWLAFGAFGGGLLIGGLVCLRLTWRHRMRHNKNLLLAKQRRRQ